MKILSCIILIITILKGVILPSESYFLNQIEFANSITIYNNGIISEFSEKDSEFLTIKQAYKTMLENHYEMPAFSVSLHNETINALNDGVWIELGFPRTFTHKQLAFEKLLIKVDKESCGFNLIRFNENKYDGRCFYINLINSTMENLYNTIFNII